MNKQKFFSTMPSPIGELLLVSDGVTLRGTYMQTPRTPPKDAGWKRDDKLLKPVRVQLESYFAGELRDFELDLEGEGTMFQQKVWKELCAIPYGETISYGELARRIGQPTASRAVGLANGQNPIAVIVPCHRVIGANGSLTGYGGGLPRKQWLLAHEQGKKGGDLFA